MLIKDGRKNTQRDADPHETAGDANHNRSDIEKLIKRADYHVRAVSIKKRNLDRVLDKPTDRIAVAGGTER